MNKIADLIAEHDELLIEPLVRNGGYDPMGSYGEWFWLPTVGPSCLWIYRRLVTRLETFGHPFKQNIFDLSEEVGLVLPSEDKPVADYPVVKSLVRLVSFNLAGYSQGSYSVRTLLPPLTANQTARLSPRLQDMLEGFHERTENE